MATKPKKIMNVNRPESFGGGRGLSNEFGKNVKVASRSLKKRAAVKPKEPIKVTSGGNIKPATSKVTRANNKSGVGVNTRSSDTIKRQMQDMMSLVKKGKTVKITNK
ncbi:MAG: hypothetical protein EBR60_06710 [Burkholderiaceae bacterium]|nr:hypothetical protein [Burkholderiaceae bacterium]